MSTEIRILLVDDEPVIRREMRGLLSQTKGFRVAGESSGWEVTLRFLERETVEVIFSDIQMAGGSGFELAERVHRRYPKILVVFLTGYADFALDGYLYGPVDFLMKPVSEPRLRKTLERIRERLSSGDKKNEDLRVGIQTEGGYQIYRIGEIAYLEKDDRKVRIVKKDGSFARTGETLQELEEILTDYGFWRCHQSYLVPLADIEEISQERFGYAYKLRLRGDAPEIPLSRRKYYEMKELLAGRGEV